MSNSYYPPGASAELDRRAAAEEAWEAYVEEFLGKARDWMAGEIVSRGICDFPNIPTAMESRLLTYTKACLVNHVDDGYVLNEAVCERVIPGFDTWSTPEPDPDRKRDEQEDR